MEPSISNDDTSASNVADIGGNNTDRINIDDSKLEWESTMI